MPEETNRNENLTPKPNSIPATQDAPPTTDPVGGALRDDVAHILDEIIIPKRPGTEQKNAPKTVFENVFAAPSEKQPETPPPTIPAPEHDTIVKKLGGTQHERTPRQTKLADNEKTGMIDVMPDPNVVEEINPDGEKAFDMRALHTLKDDLQTLVDDNQMSMVKAAALEEEKRMKLTQKAPPPARKSGAKSMTRTVFFAVTLLFLGLLGIGAVLLISTQRQTSNVQVPLTEIMFSEQTLGFPLVAGRLASEAKQQLSLTRTQVALTLGAIARIAPLILEADATGAETQRPATTEEFFQAIGASPPPELVRALSSEFFFGVHALDQNLPLLVIPISSYERAFSGMLAWEARINTELSPIFTLVPPETRDDTGLPTQRTFEDVIIQNYDVRILRDQNGTVRFLYTFPTRDVLIIAESPNSFIEILARLRAERRL